MIRMIQSTSAAHAKAYFSDALQKSDYYVNDQELQGRFYGRLANRIGVTGATTKEQFFALCENVNPLTGEQLTPRNRDERTIGYDINFHCPKSVSLIHALSKDDHVLKAFQASVIDTMKDIEADSMTRVRRHGRHEDRYTGELIWSEFTHQTARPVDGSAPDPHLHSHCFVFNATWDEQEQQIKAGQFRDIKRDMPYYQARFHKNLSDKLMKLGYRVRLTDKSFEIEGVPQSVIDMFCKRTNEIGQFAKEKGITDARALGEIGARTRAKKQKGLTMDELKQEWRKQIRENIDLTDKEENKSVRYENIPEPAKLSPNDCVDYAVKHAFERVSVIPDRRLLEMAYRHSIGSNSVALNEITNAFSYNDRIIHVKEKYRNYCTTKEVISEEKQMVKLARKGQGKFAPFYNIAPDIKLEGQQGAAIAHVLTTPHQVSIIRGAAGSGKTTLMTEATQWIKQAGKNVIVVAPTAQASRGVLVSEGFTNAETVAKLLVDKNLQESLKDQVLWVDEAGLLGTKDMTALLSLADKQNARVILGGDTRQHASVVRGDALRILNVVAGIKTAEVNKIRRQQDIHYRAAVEDLAKGNTKDAFIKLASIGAIKNIDPLKPNELLVADYMKAVKKGKSVLIVSPTHEQGNAVTINVRQQLKDAGLIGKKEIAALKLQSLNYTEAEKSDVRNYAPGQYIQFNQNVPKIKRGTGWLIDEVDEKTVTIKNLQGIKMHLPLSKAGAFDVYQQKAIGLAKGDKVKITRNSFDGDNKRLNNGQTLEVQSIEKNGKVTLVNKASKSTYRLDKEFGHIDHAYCSTSHSAQGKTVDQVFISQPASTFSATDAKQFYVSVSRGKEAVTIYTDDRAALLEHAADQAERQSALELLKNRSGHIDYILQNEINKQTHKKHQSPANDQSLIKTHYQDYEPRL